MRFSQRLGGIAAFTEAACFLFAIVIFLAVVGPDDFEDLNPQQTVAYLADNQALMHVWYLVGYVVFGVFLVVLALALHERLKTATPAILVQSMTTFGLIWAALVLATGMIANTGISAVVDLNKDDPAQAATVWQTLDTVINGIGGGDEIVGGLWILLVSWAAMNLSRLPSLLNYLGIIIGIAGIITIVPGLDDVGAIFGLGFIIWFIWSGVVMFRDSEHATT